MKSCKVYAVVSVDRLLRPDMRIISSRGSSPIEMKGVGVGVGVLSGICNAIGCFALVAKEMAVAGDAVTAKGQNKRARYRPILRLYKIARTMIVMLSANGIDSDRAFAEAVVLQPHQN